MNSPTSSPGHLWDKGKWKVSLFLFAVLECLSPTSSLILLHSADWAEIRIVSIQSEVHHFSFFGGYLFGIDNALIGDFIPGLIPLPSPT